MDDVKIQQEQKVALKPLAVCPWCSQITPHSHIFLDLQLLYCCELIQAARNQTFVFHKVKREKLQIFMPSKHQSCKKK